jgi:hypothetical protein
MSYSNPLTQTITITGNSFASADATHAIKAPLGCSGGRLRDIQAAVTTTCAGGTTKPIVKLGKSGTLDKYATLNLGTTAAGASVAATSFTEDSITDTDLLLTLVAATGAGAAGVASVIVIIDWF